MNLSLATAAAWLPAAATILAAIAAAFALARRIARRMRRDARVRTEALRTTLQLWVDKRVTLRQAHGVVRNADASTFWSALESLRVRRRAWREIARVVTGTQHAVAERRALRDDSPWRRELAARRLGLVHGRAERRALRAAMARGPEFVTFAAARALARHRDAPSLRWILAHPRALARRRHAERTALLQAFGRGGARILSLALEGGVPDVSLERAVVEALGQVGRGRDAEVILPRLTHPDADVRATTARALGRMRSLGAALALARAVGDPAWPVRAQAARALGAIGAPLAVEPLAEALEDHSWWVRRHAAYALASLGSRGIAALRHIEVASEDPYAREMAREALSGGRSFRVPRV